ncbi:Cytochrome c [Stieleria maiorica]|uniref:Cytochrome c n=2 Tax=Stieleria maiorica TaxID=2795974 RepID=A0A5B9MJT3_9BACT|nr:Cytochrome c [Stieleria maiorica]
MRSKWFAILGMLLWIARPTAALALDEAATLALLVRTIQQSESDGVRSSLMKGMLRGLEGRRDVQPPDEWNSLATELARSDDPSIRDAANRLSQIFGDTAATERALATLRDPLAPDSQRQAALASLVSQRDTGLAEELESLLDVDALRLDAIRAYAVIATQDAPRILLSRYATSPREAQSATIETLATRKAYAKELVRAIKDQTVPREHIPSYIARTLRELLGQEFTAVYGEIPELEKNVSERIAKFKRLITDEALATADARRGRVVFQKTCGACHLMYGAGGKVGPDLTGSNRANLDYFLLNSVDPSGDVPEGYRTQLVQTVDGRVLTGVLAEEDSRRIVLKTVDQPRLVIAKDEIEARKVSEKSMMPEGQLEQLPREDLFDLVKYMQTKSQVEAAE